MPTKTKACFNCESGTMRRTTREGLTGLYCADCDTFEPDNQRYGAMVIALQDILQSTDIEAIHRAAREALEVGEL